MTLINHSTPPHQRSHSASLPSSTIVVSTPNAPCSTPAEAFTPISTAPSSSSNLVSSPLAWKSLNRSTNKAQSIHGRLRLVNPSIWRWMILLSTLTLSIYSLLQLGRNYSDPLSSLRSEIKHDDEFRHILRPHGVSKVEKKRHDPVQWLRENSSPEGELPSFFTPRPKAALISLVRNEELEGILQSMRQLEMHWNRRYQYPWIFFNEKPFSEEFKVRLDLFQSLACLLSLNKYACAYDMTPSNIY